MLQAVKKGWRFFVEIFAFRTGWEQDGEASQPAGEVHFADAACGALAPAVQAPEDVRAAG